MESYYISTGKEYLATVFKFNSAWNYKDISVTNICHWWNSFYITIKCYKTEQY